MSASPSLSLLGITLQSNNARRILVSQDGHEIYITFPEYDENWASYLNGGSIARAGFMEMVKYGPYCIDNAKHMQMFAEIALNQYFSP